MLNAQVSNLKKVKDILKKGWTQKAFARNSAGEEISSSDPEATCFCIKGAEYKAWPNSRAQPHIHPTGMIRKTLESHPAYISFQGRSPLEGDIIVIFNDHPDTTQQDVLTLIDRTIERIESHGQPEGQPVPPSD